MQRNLYRELKARTLSFIERQRMADMGIGQYRETEKSATATLGNSYCAAMARSLYSDLDRLTNDERQAWIGYFDRHQDDDGLFRDPPAVYGEKPPSADPSSASRCPVYSIPTGAEAGQFSGDPLWNGRAGATCGVVTALACLGSVARKPLRFLRVNRFDDADTIVRWLESRDWTDQVACTGNEIMNVGVLLQYARDFQNDDRAGAAIATLLEWMATHHVNPATGVWGDGDVSDPIRRSHAVQAAYHWWPLFFYDGVTLPYVEHAIDTVLATQNPNGGFGCGVHNPKEPWKSSACEDIDSTDPLARLAQKTPYRKEDIRQALAKAAEWVLKNQVDDGGFVFVLDQPPFWLKDIEANTGVIWTTWFRTLSLAIIGKALPEHPLGQYDWNFVKCPGYQFWHD